MKWNEVERVRVDFDLPWGGLVKLAEMMGLTYGTISYCKMAGVPVDLADKFRKAIADINRQHKLKIEEKERLTTGSLGHLPYGGIAEISRQMNEHYNTVRHWHRYGIPVEHRNRVKAALKELGYATSK